MSENSSQTSVPTWQKVFLEQHRLPSAYLQDAQRWFAPLAESLAVHQLGAKKRAAGGAETLLLGVNGSQGSGKTTVCAYLCAMLQAQYGLRTLALSLDDFYLTRARRRELASSVHPLFATRGVPGTHDIGLLNRTLDALLAAEGGDAVAVPRFDKAQDDRRPRARWDVVEGRPDLVLLEGWCLGSRPQHATDLLRPVNALERDEDPHALWREHANASLRREFLPLYQRIDCWVMLQAPSFDCVYRWRLEQEHKLAADAAGADTGVMSDREVARFVQHFQRLTEHTLATLPPNVDYLYALDDRRRIASSRPSWETAS